ncbi:MAG: cupin domain-containing protein [Pseudomonadales bacterium]
MRALRLAKVLLTVALLAACSNSEIQSEPQATATNPQFDAIDKSIYFAGSEANDPFFSVYEGFRERRTADMNDATRPPPIEPYQSVHLARNTEWNALEDILQFDWPALNAASSDAVGQLKSATKVKRVFDHPDLKIIQLMLAPGASIPMHAEGAPGVYLVTAGSGEITVDGVTQSVTPGTRVKLEPYAQRSLYAGTQKDAEQPLKLLWIRWAPNGDHRYIKAGYYLTGANQHVQAEQATIPDDYQFWDKAYTTEPVASPHTLAAHTDTNIISERQRLTFAQAKAEANPEPIYPGVPVFGHESDAPWLSVKALATSNLMWAKDIVSTGELLERWSEVVRMESVFQARHDDGRWDFNISQQAWGSGARYVEHSHSIPEFYYMVSGSVQHWNGDKAYTAEPGDVFMTNSFQNHESAVAPNGEIWRSYGATWAPNGDRSVFERPHFLLAPLPIQAAGAVLSADESFQ